MNIPYRQIDYFILLFILLISTRLVDYFRQKAYERGSNTLFKAILVLWHEHDRIIYLIVFFYAK